MKIINKTRLLAIRKTKLLVLENIKTPIQFTLVGGVARKRETLEDSLIRETIEEIDLKIQRSALSFFYALSKPTAHKIIVKHYYTCFKVDNSFKIKETEKFKDVYWLEWKEAIKHMDKLDKIAVKRYFENTTTTSLKRIL
jgi:ADP-ribose pyrophosphatase YjhB (NUDIX family)